MQKVEKKNIINKVRVFWQVEPEQKSKVEKMARKLGVSPSEIIRNLINKTK